MSDDLETARDDLAFLRALAETPSQPNKTMGLALFSAGLIYSVQALVQWAAWAGYVALPGPFYLAFVISCSLVFFIVLGVIIWRNRKKGSKSVSARAYESAFEAAGIANLAIVSFFIVVTIRQRDPGIWYYYTPTIFAVQAGAWFAGFRLRKRLWLGLVSAGWITAAIGLGLTAHTPTYVLIIAVALFALLAVPGWIIMRLADKQDA
ncbi:hypothetical protein RMQ97_12795 [Maricaulis sp. D1M11]|uniref:hypothetical protein n=1 Tax=Maricaulis sp. D1M11 TaxID=3076117 RepID=UPI0039B47CF6